MISCVSIQSVGEISATVVFSTCGCIESGPGDLDGSQFVKMLMLYTLSSVISNVGSDEYCEEPLLGMLLLSSVENADLK